MSRSTAVDGKVTTASVAFAEELRARLLEAAGLEGLTRIDAERLGIQAAEWVAATVVTPGTSLLARRIGPIYTIGDLGRWLVSPGGVALTGEAVRKRAVKRQLVAVRTDDGQWAFPAWQFSRVAGRLVARDDVIALWRQLPHDGFLTDADLAAWLNTQLESLATTPVVYADENGVDAAPLQAAVARLRARAA